jgi:hypothetical protein
MVGFSTGFDTVNLHRLTMPPPLKASSLLIVCLIIAAQVDFECKIEAKLKQNYDKQTKAINFRPLTQKFNSRFFS